MKSRELLKILVNDRWVIIRKEGSHLILRHPFKKGILVFPYHGSKEVGKGLAQFILKKAGIK